MSIPIQTPYNIYTANGVTIVFPFSFLMPDVSSLSVLVGGVLQSLNSYTVSGIGMVAGGNVAFNIPPAPGLEVMLKRAIPLSRDIDYQDNGDLLAETVNRDFNRIWMAIQQANVSDDLSLKRRLGGVNYDAKGATIINLAEPINGQDAVTKNYADKQLVPLVNSAERFAIKAEAEANRAKAIADSLEVTTGYLIGPPIPWTTEIAPEGYIFMHGQAFNKEAYPGLAIAYPKGVIPNMRGQVIKGATEGRPVLSYEEDNNKRVTVTGETDDANIGTLSTSVAPPHAHTYQNMSGGAGLQTVPGGGVNNFASNRQTTADGEHSHSITIPPHKHTFTVYIPGADEVTVKNTAYNYIVRLA